MKKGVPPLPLPWSEYVLTFSGTRSGEGTNPSPHLRWSRVRAITTVSEVIVQTLSGLISRLHEVPMGHRVGNPMAAISWEVSIPLENPTFLNASTMEYPIGTHM